MNLFEKSTTLLKVNKNYFCILVVYTKVIKEDDEQSLSASQVLADATYEFLRIQTYPLSIYIYI